MGLFSYLNQKIKAKFSGVIELPFQNGNLGNIKEHNTLVGIRKFEPVEIKIITELIQSFVDQKFYGVLKVPFDNGVPGKATASRTIKAEDL